MNAAFPSLSLRAGLRHHLQHRMRTALAVLGVAAGTALLVGIRAALETATGSFERAAATLAGSATHAVRAGPEGVPAAVLGHLARTGGPPAAPVVATVARRAGGGPRYVLRVFGCDPLAEASLRGWARAPGGGAALPVDRLLAVPGGFAATPAVLGRLGCGVGDEVGLTVLRRPVAARCVGVLDLDPASAAGLEDVLLVDVATAQEWTGRPGHVDRIDLRLPAGAAGDAAARALAAGLAARFGPSLRLEPVRGHGTFAQLTRSFRVNLQALGLLALLVGAFLVHAAMRTAVLARRTQFAVLRALGMSARRLGALVAAEALVLGAIGSALGLGLGALFADALLDRLARTLNDHYATFTVHAARFPPGLLAGALLLGTSAAVFAALGPARAAARTPPRAVLVHDRLPAGPAGGASARRVRWLVPAALLGTALLWAAGPRIELAYAGLLLLLLVVAAVTPALAGALLAPLAALARGRGPWPAYVVRSALAARHRTGAALAALVLALSTTIGLGVLEASFRSSVERWLARALPADVYVSVPAGVDERPLATFDPATAAALCAVPGVAAATTYRNLRLHVAVADAPPQPTLTVVLDPTPLLLESFALVAGDEAAARAAFAAGTAAMVGEPLAGQRGIAVGDRLTVHTDQGPRRLPVAGVFRDYGSTQGVLNLPARWFGPTVPGAMALEAAPGVEAAALAGRVREVAAAAGQEIQVTTRAALRENSLALFDRTFGVTTAMRVVCILVAFLGIYGAFAALQLERTAELGVLRALGALPRHVAGLMAGQSALLGLCAGLLALPVGAGLGYVLIHVVNRGSFGWTLLGLSLPPRIAAEALLVALAASLAAAVQPALRARSMVPAAALREA